MVTDLLNETSARVTAIGAKTLADIRNAPARLAALSPDLEAVRANAKKFLYANLYNSPGMEDLHAHAEQVVQELFGFLMADPSLLPADHQTQIPGEGLARTVADYIAGMTDAFIEQLWARCG
jgi:dGTPase